MFNNLKVQSSDKKVVNTKSLYTGLMNVKVVALNPTLKELKALGYNIKEDSQEPQYYKVNTYGGDDTFTELHFLVEGTEIIDQKPVTVKNRIKVVISDRDRKDSSTGKKQYIYGGFKANEVKTLWLENPEDIHNSKYPPTKEEISKMRVIKEGEEVLMNLLINWLNLPTRDIDGNPGHFMLNEDEWKKLQSKEGVKDFEKSLKDAKAFDNDVQVLFTVTHSQDGSKHYQNIDTKMFGRATDKQQVFIDYHNKSDYNVPKGDYSYEFKEWEATPVLNIPTSEKELNAPSGDAKMKFKF